MLLSIKNLRVNIRVQYGTVPAVRGIDLDVDSGEIVGVVGESGSGKSTAMLALAGLLPENSETLSDSYELCGKTVDLKNKHDLLEIRRDKIAYIFQDPQASLNPVMKIGDQMVEAIRVCSPKIHPKDALKTAEELLLRVKINRPGEWLASYPHQLSGGMKQRVMIAMALSKNPAVLVADEPTTSLDVTIQAEILNLLKEINLSHKMTILFITHDLSLAKILCDRIAVMYAGKIAEMAPAQMIANEPLHPYTAQLWGSIPRIDRKTEALSVIPGNVPNPLKLPDGCKFHPRCLSAKDECKIVEPLIRRSGNRQVACYFPNRPI